ncbi:hypothetical protein [Hymenobacter sp. BT190]|uniref:hypothetical protein n=1 Tax=Hymenobacter sp. BT190 TaxID=2763505 RepID=UPI001650DFD3|nr:hypothetical protein [Hymenobacter sp. BT190]MBC6698175.1 hypothetical protein [Hymenobacter sp. BT190]
MQTHPSSDSNDATNSDNAFDNSRQAPDNIRRGAEQANQPASAAGAVSHTPQYGEFGHAEPVALTPEQLASHPAGTNPGGVAAPSYAEPEQRGSVPQNLEPEAVRDVKNAEYEDQREGWAKDDPRYAGGTRNWPTAEPANQTTSTAEQEGNDGRTVSNDGSNDNPDEFSALRPDGGKGVPGK